MPDESLRTFGDGVEDIEKEGKARLDLYGINLPQRMIEVKIMDGAFAQENQLFSAA